MENTQNQSKTITISKVEMTSFDTGNQYKITSSEGVKYKFYNTKKDGNPTVAFKQFQDMGIKIGSTVEVWYKELAKEYEGKPYTDRIIASFREAVGRPAQATKQELKKEIQYNIEQQPKDEKFWQERGRRLALHGFINGRLVNHTIAEVKAEINELLALEDEIDKKLAPIDPSDIPF